MISVNPQNIVSKNIGNAYRGERVEYLHVTHDGAPSNYSVYRVSDSGMEYVASPAPTYGLPYEGDYQLVLSPDKQFSAVRTNAVSTMVPAPLGGNNLFGPMVMTQWYRCSNRSIDVFLGASGWLDTSAGQYQTYEGTKFGYNASLGRYWRTTDITPVPDPTGGGAWAEDPTTLSFGSCNVLMRSTSRKDINGWNTTFLEKKYQKFGIYIDETQQVQSIGPIPQNLGGLLPASSPHWDAGIFSPNGDFSICAAGPAGASPNRNHYRVIPFDGCNANNRGDYYFPSGSRSLIGTFDSFGHNTLTHPRGPNINLNETQYPGSISIKGDFASISNNPNGTGFKIAVWHIPPGFNYPYQGYNSGFSFYTGNQWLPISQAFRYQDPLTFNNSQFTQSPLNNGVDASCVAFSPTGNEIIIGAKNSVSGYPYLFAYKFKSFSLSSGGSAYNLSGGFNTSDWFFGGARPYERTPAVPVPGRVKCIRFNLSGRLIIIAHENAPHISIYRWSANGFGEKLPDCPELIAFAQAAGKTNYVRSIDI